ncbi:MAG TPA: Gfo/Idh/MocA family oxidoreductase [Candidatus Binatia bacterium]
MSEVLRLGFAGLGMAAGRLIPEISQLPYIRLTAAADLRAHALERFQQEFKAEVYESVEAMCESPNVDAVYVATPHEFHARHTIAALKKRKHVIVEKPMAVSMEEAEAMNAAAEENGVKLMSGHTHSFDPPIRKMREIIAGGALGRLLMISTAYYKDHIYRPFPDHDIRMSRGVVLNQGPHQVDIVRLLAGGIVKSVRATAQIGNPSRPGEGHYACYLEFADGVAASLVYSGYAFFDSGELTWGIGEGGEKKDPERHVKARKFFKSLGSEPERTQRLEARLEEWRYGGAKPGAWAVGDSGERKQHQPFFGLTVATCEKGDIRQSPDGLFIYDDEGKREMTLAKGADAREAELKEFYEGIVDDRPIFHDGRWGQATLEVCLAILQSAAERREITLSHQVPVPGAG